MTYSWNEGDPVPSAHKDADWEITGWQIYLAVFCQICAMLSARYLSGIYRYSMQHKTPFGRWIVRHLGTPYALPKQKTLTVVIGVIQFSASATGVVEWIFKTYTHETSDAMHYLEYAVAGLYVINYIQHAIKNGMGYRYFTSLNAIVDVFTIVPILGSSWYGETWLSFQYLRTYSMLTTYEMLEGYGVMDNVSLTTRRLIISMLRTICLVFCAAGTVFVMEVLGDIPKIHDEMLTTAMGEVSFMQLCYFIITTISTVGYGDFSPKTLLGRFFVMGLIIGGVIFFSLETGSLVEVFVHESSGRGSYKPPSSKPHIIICGGGVRPTSPLLLSYLKGIFHPEHNDNNTDVVMMSAMPSDTEMKELLKQPWTEGRLHFFVGSATSKEDHQRIQLDKAGMVVVLPDAAVQDYKWEDEQNTICALAIHRAHPRTSMQLLVLRPESTRLAMAMGLPEDVCYSANSIKANMLAQSSLVPGWGVLVTNLFVSSGPEAHEEEPIHPCSEEATWFHQFCYGEGFEIRGCCLAERYDGMEFASVAEDAFLNQSILVLAVQQGNEVLINPSSLVLHHGMVVFALSQNAEDLANIADEKLDYKAIYEGTLRTARVTMRRMKFLKKINYQERALDDIDKAQSKVRKNFAFLPDNLGEVSERGRMHHHLVQFAAGNQYNDSPEPHVAEQMYDSDNGKDEWEMSDLDEEGDDMRTLADQMLKAILKDGDHIVLLCSAGITWKQVATFVEPLRASYLPRWTRIVVVCAEAAPMQLQRLYSGVAFVERTPTDPRVFHLAGVQYARYVVVMAGTPKTKDLSMIDSNVVTVANSIETAINEIERVRSAKNIHVFSKHGKRIGVCSTYEFQESANTTLLMPSTEPLDDSQVTELEDTSANPLQMAAAMSNKFVSETGEMMNQLEGMLGLDKDDDWQGSINYHPRYVAGGLQLLGSPGSLLAMAFYTPGIEKVVQAMLTPSNTSTTGSIPVLVRCSLLLKENCTYGNLLRQLVSGVACQTVLDRIKEKIIERPKGWGGIQMRMQGQTVAAVENILKYHSTSSSEMDEITCTTRQLTSLAKIEELMLESKHMFKPLPLGILRSPGSAGSTLGFVFTAPPADMVLGENDMVYLLTTELTAQLLMWLELHDPPTEHLTNLPCLVHSRSKVKSPSRDHNCSEMPKDELISPEVVNEHTQLQQSTDTQQTADVQKQEQESASNRISAIRQNHEARRTQPQEVDTSDSPKEQVLQEVFETELPGEVNAANPPSSSQPDTQIAMHEVPHMGDC